MAKIYYQLIISGAKTIDDVPQRIKAEVEQLLKDNGYSEMA